VTTPTEVAGRYRLDHRLGAGGMSTVFLAMDTVLEREVAVKLLAEHLAEDEAFVARFRREALAAARLMHPNIVQVFDSGQDPGSHRHFIVMEYVEGPSCADMLRDNSGRLDVELAVRVVRDACHGLDYAHRAGVVHRDVKPGNLLVQSETGTTKLADFGIAKAAEQTRITQVGSVLGTAAYLSPEQARGEESEPPSDIYSLGVCAYQFLAGRLPHEYGSLTELALKQQSEAVEPITTFRPEIPPALDRAVRLCLEREPAARYESALQLAEAVEAGLRGEDTAATIMLTEGRYSESIEATQALPADTAATQALRTRTARRPDARVPRRAAPPAPSPARRAARPRRRRRRGIGSLIATLAVLLAGVAVALAIVQASDNNSGGGDVIRDNVQGQVDRLKELIQENTK
jgi:eukaryotic-like serine/threonine-protein kinase